MKNLALSIFKNAKIYERAATALQAAAHFDTPLLLPSNVNAALSLELYLKSLNILEHGVEFKIKGKHSHHFGQLYNELNEPTKLNLNMRFKSSVSQMNIDPITLLEREIGRSIPRDLKTNLNVWACIFTDLRYTHSFMEKYKEKPITMVFYPQIAESIVGHILEREPSWIS